MSAALSHVTDPETAVDWQMAVDVAHGLLVLDAARQYGLVRGGPVVNVDRCTEIVERGQALGYEPSPRAVEDLVEMINGQAGQQ